MLSPDHVQGTFLQRLYVVVHCDICQEQLEEMGSKPATWAAGD